ncbi:MAG: S41 family peptidase [Fimbriimonas sp.]
MLSTLLLFAAGTAASGPWISGSEVRSDLAILRQALTTIHPGIYRYRTARQIEASLESLERRFANGSTQGQLFLGLSEFTATIQCGHTFPSFWNQPAQTKQNLFMGRDKLPFRFTWIDRRMFITKSSSEHKNLSPGTEVLSINGVPTKQILSRLLRIVKGDGANDNKRIAELGLQDQKKWEAFDIYYALAYPPKGVFDLRIQTPSGAKQTVHVDAVDQSTRLERLPASSPEPVKDGEEWTWTYPRPDTALLTMPNWALYNSTWNWKAFLRRCFVDLQEKGAKHLIMDVRGNGGGDEVGDEIIRYLVREQASVSPIRTYVRVQAVDPTLRPYLRTWDPTYYNWSSQSNPLSFVETLRANAYEIRSQDHATTVITPLKPQFQGRVTLLVDAENSSATFQFATMVRQYKVGIIVGEPTGGNQRGINGGAIFFLTLPNSQIEVDVPIIAYVPSGRNRNEGLQPDVWIKRVKQDITSGFDRVLDTALRQVDSFAGIH